MVSKELLEVKKKARTFEGTIPPAGARLVGTIKGGNRGTEYYYEDDEGNCYYTNDAQLAFEREMAQASHKRKRR